MLENTGASEDSLLEELETEAQSNGTPNSTPEPVVKESTKVLKDSKRTLPVWARPPWPEWSDEVINREMWEENESVEIFEDPAGEIEPKSLKASNWIRPSVLFVEPPKLMDWTVPIIDLITPNAHLCEHSEAIRFILSEISELYDYGVANEFLVEGEGGAFNLNSERDGISWKPWDHIYSCCKAGVRGERPIFNQMGKYYVRLYFMGCWRRITVDDRIPLLQNGRIGLPITSQNELWPMILTKALLKIASLTWMDGTGSQEIKKFSSISALTGWVHEWIDVQESVISESLWNELTDILPKYKKPAVTSSRGDEGKETKKANEGDEAEGLWWLPDGSGDKEEDGDYQDYSDSDKVTTDPILNEGDIPPPPIQQEEQLRKSKKKPKKKKKKSHGHNNNKAKKEKEFVPSLINISPAASEGELEDDVKVEEPAKMDTKTPKKKGKKDTTESHDTSTEKKLSKGSKVEQKKKGKKNVSESLDTSTDKKLSTVSKGQKTKKDGKKGKQKTNKGVIEKVTETENDEKALTVENKEEDSKDISAQKEESSKEDSKDKNLKDKKGKKLKDKKAKKDTSTEADTKLKEKVKKRSDGTRRSHEKVKKASAGGTSEEETPIDDEKVTATKDKGSADFNATTFKAALMGKLAKRAESRRDDGGDADKLRLKSTDSSHGHRKVPRMQDILQGVKQYSGMEHHSLLLTWEAVCGKNVPVALTVILKVFPKPEEDGTVIPSFLYHPIQLIELRDIPLFKESDRPSTPLWKTFRWKDWAMKKGIIPMEKPHSHDAIRSVKIRTPFVLKIDWYDSGMGIGRNEHIGEYGGEDYEYMEMADGKLRASYEFNPPPVPPTTSVTIGVEPCVASVDATTSIVPNIDSPKQPTKLSINDESKPVDNSKTVVTNIVKIPAKSGKNRKVSISKVMSGSVEELLIQNSKEVENLTDEEEWLGEEEETMMLNDFKTSVHEIAVEPVEVVPTMASGTLWFHCDSLASGIRQFCKFYSTRTTFGSCFILRRNADWAYSLPGTTNNSEVLETAPMLPQDITDYHSIQGSQNRTIKFEILKILNVTSFHLDQSEGIDSAFYLFSDCWTQQEIMITVEILQDLVIKQFTDRAFNQETVSNTTKKRNKHSLNLTFVLEPWDWRNDCCMETPLISASTNSTWATHLTLPAGRNTFRIWLVEDYSKNSGSSWQKLQKRLDANRKTGIVPFVTKFVSKTPIHVGSREEIQNYMTNEPVLFLKQCERLAQNIWTMFLLFGKSRYTYANNLRNLRKSYCPSYSEPNIINKRLKVVHETFENYFVSKIVEMNQGKVDRFMIIALKCLFLNPALGQGYGAPKESRGRAEKKELENILKSYRKLRKFPAVNTAVLIIQKYCRGWMVRRLFQIRMKGHKMYLRIEFQVRKIALILAKNTDSAFSGQPDTRESTSHSSSGTNEKVPPEPTVIPNPPLWSVDILKHLLRVHPLLISVHPHAYCIPHHIKIREIHGFLPSLLNHSTWLPFLRQLFIVPGESKWCYCMIDLQVYPSDGIVLKIINNDTQKCLSTSTNQIFLGRLRSNKLGYTMMGYRWATQNDREVLTGRVPSNQWKIRIITPNIQESLVFKDELLPRGGQIPRKLSLRRLTGYYLPNKDFSICRYTMETSESSSNLSIRFRTNYEHVKVRLQIWDLKTKTLVLEHTATGGFLLPAVLMENSEINIQSENSSEIRQTRSAQLGVRPISEFELNSKKRPVTEPAVSSDSGTIQRYAVSIFVVDNSWPLTDRQWLFVHHKRRKFFKKLRKWSFKSFKKDHKNKHEEEPVPDEKPQTPPTMKEKEAIPVDELDDGMKLKRRKSRKNKPLLDPINTKTESKPDSTPKQEVPVPSKIKNNNIKAAPLPTKKGKKDESLLPKISKNSKTDTKSPEVTEQRKASIENVDKPAPCKQKKLKKDHTHHVKKQISSNLTVKSGGRHSQKIHHESQPSWLLEIVTDAGTNYKFISSREKFKQELRETKKEWQSKGTDRLAKGLTSRRNYLLRHLVPVNYKASNPFAFVNPMANFYSCLYLEKYDLDGYKEKKFIKCLKEGWRRIKSHRKTVLLKHLENAQKIKEAKKAGQRVTKIDSRFKRKENGILLKRLKHLPRFLSKRKEQWLKMKTDMEEKIQQDNTTAEAQKNEVGQEIDDAILKLLSETGSVGNIPDKPVKTSKTKAKRKTGPSVNPQTDDGSLKNGDSDAPSGKKKKGKKDKTDQKPETTETDKTKPKNIKRSLVTKSATVDHAADKKRKSNVATSDSKKQKTPAEKKVAEGNVSEKQGKINTESQTGKEKREKPKIVKRIRSITIRDGLLTARQLHPTSRPSQVRIIRSGGDKHCQLKAHDIPVTEENAHVTDTSIGDRLLNWAFNYNCMKKESTEEDPTCGACADEITLTRMTLHKAVSGELKKSNSRRYAMPPPKRPTHVLIGPKITKCGLDPTKEQQKRLNGEVPWSLRDKREERKIQEENLKAWHNTHEEMQIVFENFKVDQHEEKNKYIEDIYKAAIERGKKNREAMNTVRNAYTRVSSDDDLPSVSGSSDSFDSSDDCETAPLTSQRTVAKEKVDSSHDSSSKILEYETEETGDGKSEESSETCSDWDEDDDYINYLQLAMASQSFNELGEMDDDVIWENEEYHGKRLSSFRPHRESEKAPLSEETEIESNSKSTGSREDMIYSPVEQGMTEGTKNEVMIITT